MKLRARSLSSSRRGFTIVEVVVAMGIFLLGMSSILGLLAFGAALTRTAALRTDAASAVEAVVADLEETLFPLVPAEGGGTEVGPPAQVKDHPVPGYPGIVYSAEATPNPADKARAGGPLEYRVEVEITWKSGGERRSRKFRTLLLRELSFGERLRRQLSESR